MPPRNRGRRRHKASKPKKASPTPKSEKRKIRVDNVISVKQLAHELGVKAPVVMRYLMDMGRMATVNEMLDVDTVTLVAAEFEYEVENVGFQEQNYLQHIGLEELDDEDETEPRPPVVTVMGHVDHGKTTLLDAIRSARVASAEAGGITQHIGAYQVEQGGQMITFLDTPGHEAFTAMRAQGAGVTDLVVLVVAADDGVQPQTVEAISHARAADVPIIVAVNKMDKPGVTSEPIMQRLTEHGLVSEEWGGDTMFVEVSALKGDGLDELLEAINLQSELLELKTNPDRHGEGTVIEAKMERGRGPVATVLVQRGTLKRGDHVVLGSSFGKVRALIDHRGKRIKLAGPSTPVFLFGLSELPEVGDTMAVVVNEKNARKLAEHRGRDKRAASLTGTTRLNAEDLFAAASAEKQEQLLLVLKADVQGTLQALKASIEAIEVGGAEVRILHAGVGEISESDVTLASSDDALLIGFNVRPDAKARTAALTKGVETEMYTVIYDVLDRIERQMKGLLAPTYELVRRGSAEVRLLFKISRIGTVAGSYVLDGMLGRNHMAKVIRRGEILWEGPVKGLRRFKDDVKEVGTGFECGISLDGFDEILEGDIVETYSRELVERT
jgi:translation initiation factor IF-2